MNKARRKLIAAAIESLETLKDIVEEVHDAEEEAFNNLPESLEGSDRYDMMEEAVDNLDNALSSLDDALESLECAME